ncbi:unnamed protein product [Schistosoma curassoni]|uniref:Reverse transcriptase domain-containing protein n=1 Tax=Schistosoma curassoni TaxID=6186 RepID=A0A183KFN0_9TREM|nr:unnamed protein product [Schistosoma curassoni]
MKTSTFEEKHGIEWIAQNQLEDLKFAGHLVHLSHTHGQTTIVAATAASESVGLNIHKDKSKILKYHTQNTNNVTLDGEALADVKSFAYLGSIIDVQG